MKLVLAHRYLAAAKTAGDSTARERLERVVEVLISERCRTFDDCISWARRLFEVLLPIMDAVGGHPAPAVPCEL